MTDGEAGGRGGVGVRDFLRSDTVGTCDEEQTIALEEHYVECC